MVPILSVGVTNLVTGWQSCPLCVFMKVMLCSPHHDLRTMVVGFASYVAVPALCVLCTLPLNKLTKGAHMFSIPCLELTLLLVMFQMVCSFKIQNAGLLFWDFNKGSVNPVMWSCLNLYTTAVHDAHSSWDTISIFNQVSAHYFFISMWCDCHIYCMPVFLRAVCYANVMAADI